MNEKPDVTHEDFPPEHVAFIEERLRRRVYAEFQGLVIPMIGELIQTLILEGKSEEEVVAAVKTAARGYSEFHLAFIRE
ncbi:hypothetical protein ACQSED_13070 [Salmonella enterica]|uniref:hypothetical protein n=1 Tax=Salmonella enterica TaxID=28901 RepID=UPI000DF0ABB5|nr:hypothetical protein DOE63_03140 [Salmonella enterica subsp. diarizonae serovar 59:z10:-]